MNQEIILKKCNQCGALIQVLKDCDCKDCGIMCCNEPMEEVTLNDQEASFEKHIPNYQIKDNNLMIKVNHVMDPDHYIEMIIVKTDTETYIKNLKPEETPELTYPLNGVTTIYSYCNKHGLWKTEVKKGDKNG